MGITIQEISIWFKGEEYLVYVHMDEDPPRMEWFKWRSCPAHLRECPEPEGLLQCYRDCILEEAHHGYEREREAIDRADQQREIAAYNSEENRRLEEQDRKMHIILDERD